MAENFDLIFGQSASQQYGWSDSDYQNGWETVGSTPPTAGQFDALQRRSDTKSKELNDRLTPIETNNTNIFRQPSTAYALKDIRFYPELPAGWYLECTVAGTTDSGAITLPSPVIENAVVTDGTVTWTIRKIGSGGGEAIGVIKAFAGNGDIPAGYLLCDGAAYSRTMFPDLFSAIGTTYGSGDGSSTFNVPDFNTAARFAQGGTVAGVEKEAGLPNITGTVDVAISTNASATNTIGLQTRDYDGALAPHINSVSGAYFTSAGLITSTNNRGIDLDASRSSAIYGNSDTVQPNALTVRYIIKAFDGQTADSALIDITQYAQRLEQKADINGSNMVYHRDVITTSGTYTAPVTGLYKITVKGGGGGGSGGSSTSNGGYGGSGGGEGGTTIAFAKMLAGDSATVVIGAGGSGGSYDSNGAGGGDSAVTINTDTYTGGGGSGGTRRGGSGGSGGTGTIPGNPGAIAATPYSNSSISIHGNCGGGSGGGTDTSAGTEGGGGGGGRSLNTQLQGGAGGDGFAIFEYYTPGA